MNGFIAKFSIKQTVTLRRQGGREHFWGGGVVFASQFDESAFDMSLSRQVLSAIVVGRVKINIVRKKSTKQLGATEAQFKRRTSSETN